MKNSFNQDKDLSNLVAKELVILGVCSDHNSSYLRGPAKAPGLIRKALFCGSANLSSEKGISLRERESIRDIGDFKIPENDEGYLKISDLISPIASKKAFPLVFGGDHSITYPIIKAINKVYGKVNILHFDAHLDIYPEFEGNKYSHACPFARIMEEGLAARLVQVGIRTLNETQKIQVEKYGVEVHEMRNFDINSVNLKFDGPVYISVDIDALDPAYAPGVSHFEPGGLSVRQIIEILHKIEGRIIGADIVEYNPERDINEMTAMVAAKLFKEVAGQIIGSQQLS